MQRPEIYAMNLDFNTKSYLVLKSEQHVGTQQMIELAKSKYALEAKSVFKIYFGRPGKIKNQSLQSKITSIGPERSSILHETQEGIWGVKSAVYNNYIHLNALTF